MINYIINLNFNYPVAMFVFIFLLCSLALLILYFLWKVFVLALECFVDSRLVELNKQKDRLWLAAEDLYDATDELKERTWDYEDNRKELRKLSKYVSDLEDYVLSQSDWDKEISRLWEERDTIYYFISKLEENSNTTKKSL